MLRVETVVGARKCECRSAVKDRRAQRATAPETKAEVGLNGLPAFRDNRAVTVFGRRTLILPLIASGLRLLSGSLRI